MFVIELHSRSVHVCGTTICPNGDSMKAAGRQLIDGIENKLIELPEDLPTSGPIRCRNELGDMLNYYCRDAAQYES